MSRTLLSYARTRAQLAANELEEQSLRFFEIALWALAALLAAGIGLVMAGVFIMVLYWDSGRLLAAGLLTLVYLGAAIAAAMVARKRLRERPRMLAMTLAELTKDGERLER
jgi:uncharacterized membrane protein YqjE